MLAECKRLRGGNEDDPPSGNKTSEQRLAPTPLVAVDRHSGNETLDLENDDKHDGDDTLPPSELTWLLDQPPSKLKMLLASFGLSTFDSPQVLWNRLNRYHQRALSAINVRWSPALDEIPAKSNTISEYVDVAALRKYLRSRWLNHHGSDEVIRDRMKRLMDRDDGKEALWDPLVDELVRESTVGRERTEVAILKR